MVLLHVASAPDANQLRTAGAIIGVIWTVSSILTFFGFASAWWGCLATNALACMVLLALNVAFLFMVIGGHLYLALALWLFVPASMYMTLATRPN
jgi:hypothetical protein